LGIKIGQEIEGKVFYKEEAYYIIKQVALARYFKNLLSLSYERLVVENLKSNYKTNLIRDQYSKVDFIVNKVEYDCKVITLLNWNNRFDCQKLEQNNEAEQKRLISEMFNGSYNEKSNYNRFLFIFISKSCNKANAVKAALDFENIGNKLQTVAHYKSLNDYKHYVQYRHDILFTFVVD